MNLKRTNLYDWHVKNDATIVPFAGWELPIQYKTGPITEHKAVRTGAGLFDIDHMGQIMITGNDAAEFLNYVVTADLTKLDIWNSSYSLMCLPSGGVIDDLFIYRRPEGWMIVANASNLEKDFNWLKKQGEGRDVSITDISEETYMIAFQGPKAIEVLDSLTEGRTGKIPRFSSAQETLFGVDLLIGRTGYTGEDGVELFYPAEEAEKIWQGIIDQGQEIGVEVMPIGLAARDSLRFEPGFPLYGHELNEEKTPLEGRLKWACDLEKDFIGKAAILKQLDDGLPSKLVSFELLDKGVPREEYKVLSMEGEEIGYVSTGLYAPWVDKYCGNAYVRPEYGKLGTEFLIQIRKKTKKAVVIKRPLYKPSYR
ncbi:MAG: glycine cleavage system aminomethyltransferase GcvT [Spirochaetaceae bacterium]|nr:glycine cleavage system aminomethyltransferase GcvT [Spirochaetaceae bacterium]